MQDSRLDQIFFAKQVCLCDHCGKSYTTYIPYKVYFKSEMMVWKCRDALSIVTPTPIFIEY